MRLPSASKIERVLACPGSHALPQVEEPPGPAALAGTARHEALADWLVRGTEPGDADVRAWLDDVREEAEALRGYLPEVALGYDVAWGTGRVIGANLGRDYGEVGESEVVGSADYLSRSEVLHVVDLKTGRGDVTEPARNAQLLTLAVAARAAGELEADRADGAQLSLLLAPDGGPVRWQTAYVSPAELDAHAERLAALPARVEAGEINEGAWCRYCPAKAACPKRQVLAAQTLERPAEVVATWRQMLADGREADVYRAWRKAREVLEEVGTALVMRASESPIDLGDGRVYGPHETTRLEYDAEAVWGELQREHGSVLAREAMTLETSKAGILRAARALWEERKAAGEKVTKKHVETELLARLSALVTKRVTRRVEEYETK